LRQDGGSAVADAMFAVEARDVLDALPVPAIVRDRRGAILHANATAVQALALPADEVRVARLALIGADDRNGVARYLLTINRATRRRISARRVVWPAQGPDEADLLILEEAPASHSHGRLTSVSARTLVAAIARRIRQHRRRDHRADGDQMRLVLVHDLGRRDARVEADPVDLAQILLSGWDVLLGDGGRGALVLNVTVSGRRLRFTLDGSALAGCDDAPDLRSHQVLLRTLEPILGTHRASIEVHHDDHGTRRFLLSLPLAP